jgi:hypothetical protein
MAVSNCRTVIQIFKWCHLSGLSYAKSLINHRQLVSGNWYVFLLSVKSPSSSWFCEYHLRSAFNRQKLMNGKIKHKNVCRPVTGNRGRILHRRHYFWSAMPLAAIFAFPPLRAEWKPSLTWPLINKSRQIIDKYWTLKGNHGRLVTSFSVWKALGLYWPNMFSLIIWNGYRYGKNF